MNVSDLVRLYGSQANAARKLGLPYITVRGWQHRGSIPLRSQALLQLLSRGKLRMDPRAKEPSDALPRP